MTSPFSQAAPDLAALGFTPIPLIPADAQHNGRGKAPGEYRGGHWQGMSKWQRFRDTGPSAFELGLWDKAPGANVGILCGTQAAPDLHVVAVDVDAEDPDDLDTLLSATPASPMVKRGQKGETRFFLAPKTLKTRSYDGPGGRLVDLLTGFDTRQTVVPPSVHPKTGKAYVWTAGPVAARDLPVLSEDDLQVLEEALETCGWERERQRTNRQPRPRPDDIADDLWSETKVAAMSRLSDWVPHLGLYNLRPARAGFECVESWRASSTGRALADRKRNLSIQPDGIKDWGSNNTYSAIDLVMAARDCDQAEATDWLRERLGLKDDGGVVIELGKGLYSPDTTQNDTPTTTNPLAIKAPEGPQPPTSGALCDSLELPDHLTRVPGALGELTDWITDSARRPQRGLALGAALTIIGTAGGRKYAGPTRTGTHLYVLGLARTSAGKDHALNAISRVLNAATMQAHVGPSQFMSMSALIKRLTRQPLTLSPIDEFGSFLARINGRKASTHERAITGVLRTAWGASFQTLNPPEWAGQVSSPIYSPALSIYGVSTPEEFFAALEGGDVFNGFLNRFLTIATNIRPAEVEPTADAFTVPESIVNALVSIYQAGGALTRATMHNDQADAPVIDVPWDTPAAKAIYTDFGRAVEQRESDMAFLARTVEMAQRLATIRAIGCDPTWPRVTVADMEWGRDVALWSAERMMRDASEHMAESEHESRAKRVLALITRARQMPRNELVRRLYGQVDGRTLDGIIKSLIDGEMIHERKAPPGPSGGRPKVVYVIGSGD